MLRHVYQRRKTAPVSGLHRRLHPVAAAGGRVGGRPASLVPIQAGHRDCLPATAVLLQVSADHRSRLFSLISAGCRSFLAVHPPGSKQLGSAVKSSIHLSRTRLPPSIRPAAQPERPRLLCLQHTAGTQRRQAQCGLPLVPAGGIYYNKKIGQTALPSGARPATFRIRRHIQFAVRNYFCRYRWR